MKASVLVRFAFRESSSDFFELARRSRVHFYAFRDRARISLDLPEFGSLMSVGSLDADGTKSRSKRC